MSDEPADIKELCDMIEDLARAMAIATNGRVDIFELKRNVLLALEDRFEFRMLSLLERQVQLCAFHAMRMHDLEAQIVEVKRRRRLMYCWRRFFAVPVHHLLNCLRRKPL